MFSIRLPGEMYGGFRRPRNLRWPVVLVTLAVLHSPTHAAEPTKPNIIVIFSDDHGYADLACQGILPDLITPHLDQLAAGGVRITSGYVTAPQCVPSRAGLLTGRYQNRFGVESNGQPLDGFNAQATIAERLQQAGYATGMTGKWHLGPQHEIVTHGFDDVYYKHANRAGWANFDLDGNNREPGAEDSKLYHLDANSAAACAFIKRHHDQPFFFYCAYRAPHVPLDAPAEYLDRFPGKMPERRRQALAMIAAIDDGVGQIMSSLRKYNIEDRTLIFFIGDNGAPLKIHKLDAPGGGPGWDGSRNDPLNGEKGMLSEGGIRVPYVVHWKGRIPAGQVYDHPVSSLDVAATAVALAGIPFDDKLDGVNLVPYLSKDKTGAPHETLYWRWIAQAAVREGKWKYLRGGAREYLFDLDTDVAEKRNLLESHPKVADRLRNKLASWSQQLDPPGIETRSMSTVWEQYFDYYLDGKSAPAASQAGSDTSGRGGSGQIDGWVARNATVQQSEGSIQIRAAADAKRPFIARSRLQLVGPVTARIRLRCEQSGTAAVFWRTLDQQDFPADQSVATKISASDQWQEMEFELPTRETVIHIRLYLPPGTSSIERIELLGADGKNANWRFLRAEGRGRRVKGEG